VGAGLSWAVDIDTRRTRDVSHARGLINSDGALSVVKNGNAVDPDGTHPRPATRASVPQLLRMFPGRRMEELTPDQQYSVSKEDGLAARALNPTWPARPVAGLRRVFRATTAACSNGFLRECAESAPPLMNDPG
jgi:hypothetical protein